MVVEAARRALAGGSLRTIVAAVRKLVPISHMIQTADTLRYLYLGGRIGKAQSLLGTMLHIKPLIGIEDGVIVPLGKTHTRHQAYVAMAEIAAGILGRGKARIGYLHAGALQEAQKIKELVEAKVQVVESMFGELSPALAVHTGPGMAGLCYHVVDE
jgi:DegV family protein with EDD domain